MPRRLLSEFQIADTTCRFLEENGRVGLLIFPTAYTGQLVEKRTTLRGNPEIDVFSGWAPAASVLDPLIHIKFAGDEYSGAFAQGRTMRSAPSNARFRYQGQHEARDAGKTVVITQFASPEGILLEHLLSWHEGDAAAEISTRLINRSPHPIIVEMLTSFSLGCITPFDAGDAPGRLKVHRFHSAWSAEGRLDSRTLEQLHLERSWSGTALFSERFGQVGTMPVRGWFPFVAIEDAAAGVCWGAQLAWAGSWQMEISRQHDEVAISGGLADREFGHWARTLRPGEELRTPPAMLACVKGNLDALCDRLTAAQHRAADVQPAAERELPIVFNEWATTWGVKYFVIDAGWYKKDLQTSWEYSHGDWEPCAALFPSGLAATAEVIRSCGLIPGIWFEFETCGRDSKIFQRTDWFLQRDGVPVTVRGRRFFDFCNPEVVRYLSDRVIGLLESCNFGYLKIDYNETLGIGCDPRDDLPAFQGEGLRQQIEAFYDFLDRLRHRLPELVIENCASGGHRHEPSMLARAAMSSFSDAHEPREIPIIAANLQRLILPRQSQVWAVLRAADTQQRLIYSLAATFLGRMCLSGEIDRLSDKQIEIVQRAIALYRQAAGIIREGTSRRHGAAGESWRHPTGWQAVMRILGDEALLVVHAFDRPAEIKLPLAEWRMLDGLGMEPSRDIELQWSLAAFSGAVMLLRRE
jgi:alpha-galactosidase